MADLTWRPANYGRFMFESGACEHVDTGWTGTVTSYSPTLGAYRVEWDSDDRGPDWVNPNKLTPSS